MRINSGTVPGVSSVGLCSKRFAGWEEGKRGRMGNTEAQRAQRRGEGRRGREEKRGEEREEKRSAPNAFSLRVSLLDLANFASLR